MLPLYRVGEGQMTSEDEDGIETIEGTRLADIGKDNNRISTVDLSALTCDIKGISCSVPLSIRSLLCYSLSAVMLVAGGVIKEGKIAIHFCWLLSCYYLVLSSLVCIFYLFYLQYCQNSVEEFNLSL